MKLAFLLRNPLFLREEASENPSEGGAPAAPAVDPETPEDDPGDAPAAPAVPAATVTAPAPAAEKPGFLSMAIGAAKGNGALTAENGRLKTQVGTMTAQLAALTAERDRLAARVTTLEGERAAIQAALDEANAGAQTVQESTIQALASVGVPREQLPAATSAASGGSKLEQLNAQIEASTDPVERGRLSVLAWEEMKAAQKAGSHKAA